MPKGCFSVDRNGATRIHVSTLNGSELNNLTIGWKIECPVNIDTDIMSILGLCGVTNYNGSFSFAFIKVVNHADRCFGQFALLD